MFCKTLSNQRTDPRLILLLVWSFLKLDSHSSIKFDILRQVKLIAHSQGKQILPSYVRLTPSQVRPILFQVKRIPPSQVRQILLQVLTPPSQVTLIYPLHVRLVLSRYIDSSPLSQTPLSQTASQVRLILLPQVRLILLPQDRLIRLLQVELFPPSQVRLILLPQVRLVLLLQVELIPPSQVRLILLPQVRLYLPPQMPPRYRTGFLPGSSHRSVADTPSTSCTGSKPKPPPGPGGDLFLWAMQSTGSSSSRHLNLQSWWLSFRNLKRQKQSFGVWVLG